MNFSTFKTKVRHYLGDTNPALYTWTDDQIGLYIQNAIADYSIHFPRRMNTSLEGTAGTRLYNLPYNVHGLITVEYQPAGVSTDPPTYFQRLDSMLEAFYQTEAVYDWVKNDTSSGALQPPTITFNPVTPSSADTYYIEYNGDHAIPELSADVISVPERHINLIYLFVRWQSLQELSTGVKRLMVTVPGVTLLGSQENPYSEIDLKRTMETYKAAVAAALKAESESATLHWEMDKWGRVT